ncbi:MAG: nuclear transport factor 2 family protein [Pseudohongiella nitratireducens]|nr:nuclear transport factor 2 family protein [Pseudohongiella nitratireducens]MDF1624341.1 nuclear transport factor 2 family protein [Pseudohongiella nitratireducens]
MIAAVLSELKALEKELHQAGVRKSAHRLAALLHDSFTEIGRSGQIFTKQEIIDALSSEKETDVWSQDYSCQQINDDLYLLTYRCARVRSDGSLNRYSHRSSLWQRINGEWQMRFHQGTPTEAFSKTDLGR